MSTNALHAIHRNGAPPPLPSERFTHVPTLALHITSNLSDGLQGSPNEYVVAAISIPESHRYEITPAVSSAVARHIEAHTSPLLIHVSTGFIHLLLPAADQTSDLFVPISGYASTRYANLEDMHRDGTGPRSSDYLTTFRPMGYDHLTSLRRATDNTPDDVHTAAHLLFSEKMYLGSYSEYGMNYYSRLRFSAECFDTDLETLLRIHAIADVAGLTDISALVLRRLRRPQPWLPFDVSTRMHLAASLIVDDTVPAQDLLTAINAVDADPN